MGHNTMSTKEHIEATKREIERLKNLPPSTRRRRAGDGNPSRKEAIARQERMLEILQEQLHNEEQQNNARRSITKEK